MQTVQNKALQDIREKRYKLCELDGKRIALINVVTGIYEYCEVAYMRLNVDCVMAYFIDEKGTVNFVIRSSKSDYAAVCAIVEKYSKRYKSSPEGVSFELPTLSGFFLLSDLYSRP